MGFPMGPMDDLYLDANGPNVPQLGPMLLNELNASNGPEW